ncbi:hypothetical protein F1737_00775 [Methanoplanus sp. FWC-SCC4]|uniref:Uncharacterized protein n=1 Tax=Methanochimaera problematica TaxID=2609417 RepID=A0AA97I1M6_9EURY|nr:hypothetical protein [Methanoplanus sp. FWC-SCC4]WOF15315.1 hypothetical protein F1737_00775 [Methanoplanus sp. FWC-SCC4]
MQLEKKIAIGFAIVIVFAGLMVAVQFGGEGWLMENPPDKLTQVYKTGIKAVYEKPDFSYGPNHWRPFKEPLMINPPNGSSDDMWYLMFIKANVTPYGGNPYFQRRGSVLVNYSFENLAGTAAFHIIGFEGNDAKCRTNRQEGYGANGYFVRGTAQPGDSMPPTQPLKSPNNNPVLPAGLHVDEEKAGLYSYFLHFDPMSGGIDAVHITKDPKIIRGSVIETDDQYGEFYITHTGGSMLEEILIILAVNEAQPDDFKLKIGTSFVPEDN